MDARLENSLAFVRLACGLRPRRASHVAVAWIRRKNLGQLGQSSVEYLLLLAVIVTMGYTVFRSPIFKKFFGEQNFHGFVLIMEQGYRHGSVPASDDGIIDSARINGPNTGANVSHTGNASDHIVHPTYYTGSSTHFFGPQSKYPD